MLLGILLTFHILVCIALIAVVLLQRSEGGALGLGGGSGSLVTTRGAGDVLTRSTWILFTLFVVLSLALSWVGARQTARSSVTDRLKVERIDPNAIGKAAPAEGSDAPETSAPAPLQAPLPGQTQSLPLPSAPPSAPLGTPADPLGGLTPDGATTSAPVSSNQP